MPKDKTKIATGTALVPIAATGSLARVPVAARGEIVREGGVIMVTDVRYLAHGAPVPAAEIFFDEDVRPESDGPWRGEADKIAWRDPATGYECIIMRDSRHGFLGGYVGVPASHPLYGFRKGAVPSGIGIEVHGGITYARICEDGPSPERRLHLRRHSRRICHVVVGEDPITSATDYRIEDRHQWWFGFTCDHVADLVPGDAGHAKRGAALGVAQVYRDDAYVLREVTNLAAQLRAIADDAPMPAREGPPLPPASIDPVRGR